MTEPKRDDDYLKVIELQVNHGRHRASDSYVAQAIVDALKKAGWTVTRAKEGDPE